LLLLAACGGAAREAEGPPVDGTLQRLSESAYQALQLDQPESAARLYARALTRARERDDAVSIAEMGYGQATAALAHGDADGALRVAREVRAELERRRRAVPPGLKLAEATALHRLGRVAEAEPIAADVATRGAEDGPAALRATFLLGLIAAARQDVPRLAALRRAFREGLPPAFAADALELEAHEALLRGLAASAAARAAEAAALRRTALDYRGLSRALALEGRARATRGEAAAAADLLMRAGRGAAERGETPDARAWLAEARRVAEGNGLATLAARARREMAALDAARP
jgi:hypothetical protein